MSNKNSTIINLILIIAVAILFYLQLSTSNDSPKTNEISSSNDTIVSNSANEYLVPPINKKISEQDFTNLKIAFVNSDTVSTHYLFAKDVQKSLLKKQSSAKNQVKNKYNEYQRMVDDYQQSAKIMGQSEAEEKAQKIGLLENEIMQLEQSLNQKLSNDELQLTTDYVTQTNVYMQKIGEQLGYDYVLSYRLGGEMLYANPNLDITNEVIIMLNNEYKSKK
jgi:outer membrane protein